MNEITQQNTAQMLKQQAGLQEVPDKHLRQAKGLVRPLSKTVGPDAHRVAVPAEENPSSPPAESGATSTEKKLDLSLLQGLDAIIQQVMLDTSKKIEDVTMAELDHLLNTGGYYELAENSSIDQILNNLSQAFQNGNFSEIQQRVEELRSADTGTPAYNAVVFNDDIYRLLNLNFMVNQDEGVDFTASHFTEVPIEALARLDTLRHLTTAVKAALPERPSSSS